MTNRDIGARVSALRQERKMTTTDLARRVGISQAQISRLENGLQGFRSGTLLKMAKALGKPGPFTTRFSPERGPDGLRTPARRAE